MTDDRAAPPPGWYPAQGDPSGTVRWWDGRSWVDGPVPASQHAAAGYPYSSIDPREALPELGRVLASPWNRIAATLIDGLVLVVPALIFLTIMAVRADSLDELDPNLATRLAFALLGLVYEVGFIAIRGATPGKAAMGLEVISIDGTRPPGWQKAFLRYFPTAIGVVPVLGVLISTLVEIASLILLFADGRRQTLWDRLAGTYVVRTR